MKVLKSRTSFLEHQRMTGLSQMYHTQSCLLNTWNVSVICTIFITNPKHSTITATMKKISSFWAKKQDTCLGKMSHRPSFLATYFLLQTFLFHWRPYLHLFIYIPLVHNKTGAVQFKRSGRLLKFLKQVLRQRSYCVLFHFESNLKAECSRPNSIICTIFMDVSKHPC